MFTGIVEEVGEVVAVAAMGSNRDFVIKATMAAELRIDQSVAHNGVCLTVTRVEEDRYTVTAVEETLLRTNIGAWEPGTAVNLERSLRVGDRLDGHMVQGHVDTTVTCQRVDERDGSWTFSFSIPEQPTMLVHKGSICLNGVSLTIAELTDEHFSVAIIPYTFAHTNFGSLKAGDTVNVEYDVLGKYVQRMLGKK